MRGKWLAWLRRIHTFLGVFFSPILLLFTITGAWQTFVSDDDRKQGVFNQWMKKFSAIHTDDYFSLSGTKHDASPGFQYLIAVMAISLIISILIGLVLACQNKRNIGGVIVAFVLGILVPSLLLYFH